MSAQVVLITGGLTGIGRAAAVAFAKTGAKVVVAGRRDDAGKKLVDELRSFGSEAEFINADVRKEDDVRAMVDKTIARLGLERNVVVRLSSFLSVARIVAHTELLVIVPRILGEVLATQEANRRASTGQGMALVLRQTGKMSLVTLTSFQSISSAARPCCGDGRRSSCRFCTAPCSCSRCSRQAGHNGRGRYAFFARCFRGRDQARPRDFRNIPDADPDRHR